jgi:acetoacetate decarboxylase
LRAGRIATPTGNTWSSPIAQAARRLRRRSRLTFDEPLVRDEFRRTESSTGFGRYWGAAQCIPVKLNGKPGAYIKHVSRRIRGREMWGFPQKLAKPRLAVAHNTLVGTLEY